jgi:hypothetical protein
VRHNQFGVEVNLPTIIGSAVLSEPEKRIIRECMVAILEASFIDDWEFGTRIGVSREELRAILSHPELDCYSREEGVQLAINNSMNELLHGVRISPAEWSNWLPVSRKEVLRTYEKWRTENGCDPGGII